MNQNADTDFKANVAELTKIPPNEFEKYFRDWMEQDDVARSLQAKLRCDLIKNFNKTNLGKHIMSHATGGSIMRLTLSPLVLALNTLVAEFLYAQNCHFTLSVFSTEIPFRNTLPDFESMRHFRFNDCEIAEIWEAVTGYKASKKDLNKHVIRNYETNPTTSLLLLIMKCLRKKDPLELLKRNVEIQTDIQEKLHKTTSAQSTQQENKSPSNISTKDDNLHHINKYLLTLSEKVAEMTKEFEQFAKQCHISRSRISRSSRSRDYYMLNKSLERIAENMKASALAKRKNKRVSSVVESIYGLTKEFGKCVKNFADVTKVLGSTENSIPREKMSHNEVKLKEKQTETELHEKTYADWIHEMRNTANGQKFLNRVEITIRKALTHHREHLQNETDLKMKHMKSLLKLRLQQKLSKPLLQNPKIHLENTRKCKENIEEKLQEFDNNRMQKLHDFSLQLPEVQPLENKNQSHTLTKENVFNEIAMGTGLRVIVENSGEPDLGGNRLRENQKPLEDVAYAEKDEKIPAEPAHITKSEPKRTVVIQKHLLEAAQSEILDMAKTITEQSRSVDDIICDAKLRIQQLENENKQLERNFQSYLKRRKRELQEATQLCSKPEDSLSTITSLRQIVHTNVVGSNRLLEELKNKSYINEQNVEIDDELTHIKSKVLENQQQNEKQTTIKSDNSVSSLEMGNAILEAKLKFFEYEKKIRKCKEQTEKLQNGNLMQQQLETYELSDCFNKSIGQRESEINIKFEVLNDETELKKFNLKPSLPVDNINVKSVAEYQQMPYNTVFGNMTKTFAEKALTSARRELFPREQSTQDVQDALTKDSKDNILHHKPIAVHIEDLEQDRIKITEHLEQKSKMQTDTTAQLIKQSMAKMQRLFEEQTKSKKTLREMVNDIEHGRDLREDLQEPTQQQYTRPNEILDRSLSTSVTSTTNTTANVTLTTSSIYTSEDIALSNDTKISNTSMPSPLNLCSESEDSLESAYKETKPETAKVICGLQMPIKKNKFEDEAEVNQITESSRTNKLSLPLLPNKCQEPAKILEQEIGQIDDLPICPDLNLSSPENDKEIGEIFSSSNCTFTTIDVKMSESISTHSSSELDVSTRNRDKNHEGLNEDSGSDFWT